MKRLLLITTLALTAGCTLQTQASWFTATQKNALEFIKRHSNVCSFAAGAFTGVLATLAVIRWYRKSTQPAEMAKPKTTHGVIEITAPGDLSDICQISCSSNPWHKTDFTHPSLSYPFPMNHSTHITFSLRCRGSALVDLYKGHKPLIAVTLRRGTDDNPLIATPTYEG